MNQQLHWDEAVGRLKSRVSPQNYDMWLRPIEVTSWEGNTLRLRAPNSYVRLWFESNFLSSLVKELRDLGHEEVRVEFDLWEGESTDPTANRHLGRYAVVDLPEAPAGDVLVLVEVTIDTDGVIRLGATEMVSGERAALEEIYHAGLSRADVVRLQKQLEQSS